MPTATEYWVRRWTVPSESGRGSYTVAKSRDNKWGCTCAHYRFRHEVCKHIEAVAGGGARVNPSPWNVSLGSWRLANLTVSGHYMGPDLTKWGFPYKRGDRIPPAKQHEAMAQHANAENHRLWASHRIVAKNPRRNPTYRVYFVKPQRKVVVYDAKERIVAQQRLPKGPTTKASVLGFAAAMMEKKRGL